MKRAKAAVDGVRHTNLIIDLKSQIRRLKLDLAMFKETYVKDRDFGIDFTIRLSEIHHSIPYW